MNVQPQRSWWPAATGVIFAALFVVGALLVGDLAGSYGDPDAQFVDVHQSDANRARYIAGGYLLSASAVAFVWFIVALTQRLATETNVVIVTIARVSGAIFAALLLSAAASFMTVAGSMAFGDLFDDTGQFESGMSALPQLGYVLVNVGGMLAASSTILAVSLSMTGDRRSDVFLRRGGYVMALLLPANVIMSAVLVLFLLWTVAASLVILRPQNDSEIDRSAT